MIKNEMAAGESTRGSGASTVVDEDVTNVLVCSDSMDERAQRAYYEQLLPGPAASLHVLGVVYTRGPKAWLDEWHRYTGDVPAECTLISVADGTRSATAVEGSVADGRIVYDVESPQDLTGLGITVGERLSSLSGDEQLVSFDSLTAMLQHVDIRRAFRFLHVLANRVDNLGGVGHYHIDPRAHDDQTLATLSSVFDAMARFDDGEWVVRTRG